LFAALAGYPGLLANGEHYTKLNVVLFTGVNWTFYFLLLEAVFAQARVFEMTKSSAFASASRLPCQGEEDGLAVVSAMRTWLSSSISYFSLAAVDVAISSRSARNSGTGTLNREKPQSKQTKSCGNTKTFGLCRFLKLR
jgi:hypothetical protein